MARSRPSTSRRSAPRVPARAPCAGAGTLPVTKRQRAVAPADRTTSMAPGTTSRRVKSTIRGTAMCIQDVSQRGDASVAVADGGHVGRVQVTHRHGAAPQTLEGLIVQHDDLPVARAPQVDLDPVGTERHRSGEGAQRVLPLAHGIAPVGDRRDRRGAHDTVCSDEESSR